MHVIQAIPFIVFGLQISLFALVLAIMFTTQSCFGLSITHISLLVTLGEDARAACTVTAEQWSAHTFVSSTACLLFKLTLQLSWECPCYIRWRPWNGARHDRFSHTYCLLLSFQLMAFFGSWLRYICRCLPWGYGHGRPETKAKVRILSRCICIDMFLKNVLVQNSS